MDRQVERWTDGWIERKNERRKQLPNEKTHQKKEKGKKGREERKKERNTEINETMTITNSKNRKIKKNRTQKKTIVLTVCRFRRPLVCGLVWAYIQILIGTVPSETPKIGTAVRKSPYTLHQVLMLPHFTEAPNWG